MIDNSIEAYLPLVKAIIQMENGMQPYDDELIVEGNVQSMGRTSNWFFSLIMDIGFRLHKYGWEKLHKK